MLHKQLVNVEEVGGFEVAGLARKSQQPGLVASNGQLFTVSFIPGDASIPKGVGTLSKTLALLPGKNGSQPVVVVGEVNINIEKKVETTVLCCSFDSKRLVCISLCFGVANWKRGGLRLLQRER